MVIHRNDVVSKRLGASVLALVACSRPPSRAEPPAHEAAPRVVLSPTSRSQGMERMPAASASSWVEAPAPPPVSAPASGQPCDKTSCDYATERCCENEVTRERTGCLKKADAPAKRHPLACYGAFEKDRVGMECVTAADCPRNQRCCAMDAGNLCETECTYEVVCDPSDVRSCRPGFRCAPEVSSRSGGVCKVSRPRSTCGKLACAGATPSCCYDRATSAARCVADTGPFETPDHEWKEGEFVCPDENRVRLDCTSPADCGGESCCTIGALGTARCGGACTSGTQACRTIADCPTEYRPPKACAAGEFGVPFLKTCLY